MFILVSLFAITVLVVAVQRSCVLVLFVIRLGVADLTPKAKLLPLPTILPLTLTCPSLPPFFSQNGYRFESITMSTPSSMRIATDQKNEFFPSSSHFLFVASSLHCTTTTSLRTNSSSSKQNTKTNSFFTHNKQLK
jgi:hypothetical protein